MNSNLKKIVMAALFAAADFCYLTSYGCIGGNMPPKAAIGLKKCCFA